MYEELGKREIKVLGVIPYDEQIAQACLEGKVLEGGQAGESIRRIAGVLLGETPVPPSL